MRKDIHLYATICKVYGNEKELIGNFTDFVSLNISFESI